MAKRKKTNPKLMWDGKDKRTPLEPRILLEDPELSYAAGHRVNGDNDIFDNMLIHGDNLLALKALEQDFAGKVKCAYIDPPYNTGSAFEHYDDGVEHSIWLSLMRDRLEQIRRLLSPTGSLWISIDDNECHYLKVLCDEVFGRSSFVANVVWEKVYTPKNNGRGLSSDHDHILVYARDVRWFSSGWNLLPRSADQKGRFTNPDDDPSGPWRTYPLDVRTEDGKKREKYRYDVVTPSGRIVRPPAGRHWALPKERFEEERAAGQIYFGKKGSAKPTRKVYLKYAKKGVIARTWWTYKEVGGNQDAKREILKLFGDSGFITPKPERLIERVLQIATDPGDIVLDSFAGSGTTGAVAHKMRRRWVMVELGDHAVSHVAPRLRQVVDGSDRGGITESASWRGGGGFRFYRLAPSLLEEDKWGNWVINRSYNKEMLAEAMCKLEDFRYAPSPTVFWMHGQSTETDYIYVTTQTLTPEQLQVISAEVGDERTLLICCPGGRACPDQLPNLTVKKIPAAVLERCEWGKDDYSLNVQAGMDQDPDETKPEPENSAAANAVPSSKKKCDRKGHDPKIQGEMPLFSAASPATSRVTPR